MNGLSPGEQTPLETTIGYEQVAVDLTAWPARHEPNRDYVRQVLADQIDLRAHGTTFVDVADLLADHRDVRFQQTVNAGGAPSEQVIEENRAKSGHEHRDETDGEHPVVDLRPEPAR